jgi:hypothetical protein
MAPQTRGQLAPRGPVPKRTPISARTWLILQRQGGSDSLPEFGTECTRPSTMSPRSLLVLARDHLGWTSPARPTGSRFRQAASAPGLGGKKRGGCSIPRYKDGIIHSIPWGPLRPRSTVDIHEDEPRHLGANAVGFCPPWCKLSPSPMRSHNPPQGNNDSGRLRHSRAELWQRSRDQVVCQEPLIIRFNSATRSGANPNSVRSKSLAIFT